MLVRHLLVRARLVSKRLGYLEDALSAFLQLHDLVPDSADIMCQVKPESFLSDIHLVKIPNNS